MLNIINIINLSIIKTINENNHINSNNNIKFISIIHKIPIVTKKIYDNDYFHQKTIKFNILPS